MRRASRERFREIDEIFDAVLDLPAGARDAYVAQACGGDAELRAEVDSLLDAHRRATDFLESPAVELGAPLLEDAPSPVASPVPSFIGPFRIVRELGEGGMGVVYLAERDGAEFRQRVALKLIRDAGRSEAITRRFVEERRILALLEHAGVARLIDGGLTERGQPWFAMELVEGEPIDAYCDTRRLTVDQRIDLFLAVCDAVQYAHEHLVIHRDLKPSNILVRPDGQLKLLDFGIAKLIDPLRADGDGSATQTAFVALTPEYAAPEQVRGQPVSTATDTYALGVLLYRLLSGRRPYDVRGKTAAEMERIVCEVEPARPSATFGAGDGPGDEDRARVRGTTPEKLSRQLRGDLDLIVTKALHKDPARRYSSAAALREDLRRFRTGLPVLARPDSAGYRVRKFVRRNRTVVAASLVTLAALVGATAFSASQMREAQRQRDAALHDVRRQRVWVELQNVMASDARDAEGRHLSAAQRIAVAEQVLVRQFGTEPWLVAEGMAGLAERLFELGERDAQRAMLARAIEAARPAGFATQVALAGCQRATSFVYDDQLDSARASLREGRAALATPGARTDFAAAYCLDAEGRVTLAEGNADSAVALLKQAVALAQSGDTRAIRPMTLNGLAGALRALGRTREAAAYYGRIVTEMDSLGYGGTEILPSVTAFLTSALSEIGELAAVDSVLGSLLRRQSPDRGRFSSAILSFLYGQNKLRLGQLDSVDFWIARAMQDTTEGAGALPVWLPPAITLLRLEQGRLAEARAALATLPGGTLVRRVNRSWLTARVRYAEGDVRGASAMLEDSLRVMFHDAPMHAPALALPLVTAAEWRLAAGDARGADSLAGLARSAGGVDSLALQRNAYVGRADLVRARARYALGDERAAGLAADRAVAALSAGYGAANRWTHEARSLRDSLPR